MRQYVSLNRNRWCKVCRNAVLLNFLVLIFIIYFWLPYTLVFDSKQISCISIEDQWNEFNFDRGDLELLEDVLLSEVQPTLDKCIFFIESSCPKEKTISFNRKIFRSVVTEDTYATKLDLRQGCSIESAARHNPDTDIFILVNKIAYQNTGTSKSVIDAILSYPNVHLRSIDISKIVLGSPINESLLKMKLSVSKYPTEHTADLLRLLIIWKWGGTYLDLDNILFRTLEDIPANFICAQSKDILGSGVFNFASSGLGHQFLNMCLTDFQNNYNSSDWSYNGPWLVTRNLKKICRAHTLSEINNKDDCKEMHVLPPNSFYPIPYEHFDHIFDNHLTSFVMKAINQSYSIHLWNHLSKQYQLGSRKMGAFSEIVEKNCPKINALAKTLKLNSESLIGVN